MFIYGKPSDEERERDYDSFEVMGRRMDALSFNSLGHPFAATCLGHHWANEKETQGKTIIRKLRPYFHLVNSGAPQNDFLKDWDERMPCVHDHYADEYYFYREKFFSGNLSNETSLKEKLNESGQNQEWVAKLFTEKAIQLLRPVVRSAEGGNPSAIEAISYLAHHLTKSLEKISKNNLKKVRDISSHCFFWPVLHTPHSQFRMEQYDSYIANLKTGSNLPVRVDRARWSNDSLSMLAFELIVFVHRLRADREIDTTDDPFGDYSPQSELGESCKSLPKLTKETAKSHWWPVAREIFLFSYPDPLALDQFKGMLKYEQHESTNFRSAFLNALKDKFISLSRK